MTKKSINKKEVKKFVTESRDVGKADQEIYNELTKTYYDKRGVALIITSTVTNNNKQKYSIYNNILLALICLTIILKALVVSSLSLSQGQLWPLLLIFIVPLLNFFFLYEIARYSGASYRLVGIFTAISFFQSIGKSVDSSDIIINFILCAGIAGLAFYLDSKMFPNYSPNSLKKDTNGEYILKKLT